MVYVTDFVKQRHRDLYNNPAHTLSLHTGTQRSNTTEDPVIWVLVRLEGDVKNCISTSEEVTR
mgnify:CR=1 FL=1